MPYLNKGFHPSIHPIGSAISTIPVQIDHTRVIHSSFSENLETKI